MASDLDKWVELYESGLLTCRQIEQLRRCEIIPEASVKELCQKAKEILMDEGNIQYVDSPVTVGGVRLSKLMEDLW